MIFVHFPWIQLWYSKEKLDTNHLAPRGWWTEGLELTMSLIYFQVLLGMQHSTDNVESESTIVIYQKLLM